MLEVSARVRLVGEVEAVLQSPSHPVGHGLLIEPFGLVADFIEQHAAAVDDEFAAVEVFGIGRFPLQEAEVVGAYGVPLLGTEGAVVVLAHEGDFVGREGVEYLVTELGGDGEDGELQVPAWGILFRVMVLRFLFAQVAISFLSPFCSTSLYYPNRLALRERAYGHQTSYILFLLFP